MSGSPPLAEGCVTRLTCDSDSRASRSTAAGGSSPAQPEQFEPPRGKRARPCKAQRFAHLLSLPTPAGSWLISCWLVQGLCFWFALAPFPPREMLCETPCRPFLLLSLTRPPYRPVPGKVLTRESRFGEETIPRTPRESEAVAPGGRRPSARRAFSPQFRSRRSNESP